MQSSSPRVWSAASSRLPAASFQDGGQSRLDVGLKHPDFPSFQALGLQGLIVCKVCGAAASTVAGDLHGPLTPPPRLGAGDTGAGLCPRTEREQALKGDGSGNCLWKNSRVAAGFPARGRGPGGRKGPWALLWERTARGLPSCERGPRGWTHRATAASLGSGQNHIFGDNGEIVLIAPEEEARGILGGLPGALPVPRVSAGPRGSLQKGWAAAWQDPGVHEASTRGKCAGRARGALARVSLD